MAGDSCLPPLHRLGGKIKSILTIHDFGSDYELLCTEISIQSLRLRLWGQLVGLNLDDSEIINATVLNRHDIKPVVIQTIDAISLLLGEIKDLQRKYQLRKFPRLEKPPSNDAKVSPTSKGFRTLSIIRSTSLRQRIRANQKEKSVFSIAKWALRDSRKFDEKLERLKSLIDGLEDISRAVDLLAPSPPTSQELPSEAIQETPPPYTFAATRISTSGRPQIVDIPRTTRTTRLSDNSISDLLEHHVVMKRYLTTIPVTGDRSRRGARECLTRLTEDQFKELRIDVFDDLMRRQQSGHSRASSLPDIESFHSKRNEARRKLSSLVSTRFGDLVFDLVFELERRFPQLQDRATTPPPEFPFPDPFADPEPYDTRRWGYVASPPQSPPLCERSTSFLPSQSSTSPSWSLPTLTTSSSTSSPPSPGSPTEIFKSFRVSMSDPTSRVLPAALKKYNILKPPEDYSLCIVYGNQERCLGPDERPLLLFKRLEKEGKKPLFMLRRLPVACSNSSAGVEMVADVAGGVF